MPGVRGQEGDAHHGLCLLPAGSWHPTKLCQVPNDDKVLSHAQLIAAEPQQGGFCPRCVSGTGGNSAANFLCAQNKAQGRMASFALFPEIGPTKQPEREKHSAEWYGKSWSCATVPCMVTGGPRNVRPVPTDRLQSPGCRDANWGRFGLPLRHHHLQPRFLPPQFLLAVCLLQVGLPEPH